MEARKGILDQLIIMTRVCKICGGAMPPGANPRSRYCSDECREERDRRRSAQRDYSAYEAVRKEVRRKARKHRMCRVCGNQIPLDAGPRALTCSERCSLEFHRQRERERYYLERDTDRWRAVREEYLARLHERRASDSAFDAQIRAAQRQANVRLRAAIKADPIRAAEYKARRQAQRDAMTPEQRAAERARSRAWYASLSREEKVRIYYTARAMRALERMQAIGDELARRAQAGSQESKNVGAAMAEKYTIYAGPPLTAAFVGFEQQRSGRVNQIAADWLEMVAALAPKLTLTQWSAVLDIFSDGRLDDDAALKYAWAEIDGHENDGKWGNDMPLLVERIRALSHAELLAMREIVRRFWSLVGGHDRIDAMRLAGIECIEASMGVNNDE
ncbi:DUF2116 family Zn-ribbon domain-containing protein [Thauera sp.]|uniref:DUF2116 family Zn-ribbon domain-containing protein n=1 Tax=Thauera sp. TaxID=1905334 RepID=UPI0039E56B86